jgi:beta-glucosidase
MVTVSARFNSPIHTRAEPTAVAAKPAEHIERTAAAADARAVRKLIGAPAPDVIEKKVEALLKKMTLEDKVMQMAQPAYGGAITGPTHGDDAVTRGLVRKGLGSLLNVGTSKDINLLQKIAREESPLGIPLLICHDVIYGDRTMGPVPLAMACSFDPQVSRMVAKVAGVEARARGAMLTFAPMLDVTYDHRWGRIVEGWGSSAYLSSVMGAANIAGFKEGGIATTAKHFAGYGFGDGGIDYNAVHVSKARLENEIFPPFQRAVGEGVDMVMPGFNSLNGIPCTANKWLIQDKLRGEWGGKDIVTVSDYTAIMELIRHGVAKDRKHAAELAVLAGVDIDMESGIYVEHLADLVREGRVPMQVIDDANRRILKLKYRLGLFANSKVDEEAEKKIVFSAEHKATMLRAAERSMVLLKNDPLPGGEPLLPLKKDVKKIAVVGPLATSTDMIGQWRAMGRAEDTSTILGGLLARAGADREITFAQGCRVNGSSKKMIAEAIAASKDADVIVAVLGETAAMSGEATTMLEPALSQAQVAMVKELQKKTGKPIAVVLTNGRPLTNLGWLSENVPAILEAWQPGTMGGEAVANMLFGEDRDGRKVTPGGKLATEIIPHVGWVGSAQHTRYMQGRPADLPGADGKYSCNPAYFDKNGQLLSGDPRHVDHEPLYSFGYGKSYTTFSLGGPEVAREISINELRRDGLTVKTTVTNTGDREGDEVVQLYIRDLVASEVQPTKRLVGFERVTLAPGETRTIELQLSAQDLEFFSEGENKRVLEPGEFKLWIGSSAREKDCKTATFALKEDDYGALFV